MASTSSRIERGAALLDQTAPGWERKIDLARLDLGHSSYCIIGQVYGDYYKGLRKIDGEAERRPAYHGFITWGAEGYWALTGKWRDYIEARLASRRAA